MAPRKDNLDDAPSGEVHDNSYVSKGDDAKVNPVVSDDAPVEDPIDDKTADTDAQLDRDDKEAIDKGNILKGDRTRHAKPVATYREPGDEEGLPSGEDGTSSTSTTDQVLKS
ncbi:hypothetical protein GE09DRAFT_1224806 [Coniochaeta sp. 2T2.1]|nr:hypothetical protein GE09DRAFT_1224806 [Coniochaeta sp. 2T2.1]